MKFEAFVGLVLLSGTLGSFREIRVRREGVLDNIGWPSMVSVSARSRIHCGILCQRNVFCSSFFYSAWETGACTLVPVVFNPLPNISAFHQNTGLRNYVIQTDEDSGSPPPGFRWFQALDRFVRVETLVAGQASAMTRCQNLGASLLVLPKNSSALSLSVPGLRLYITSLLYVDGRLMANSSNTWQTEDGPRSYSHAILGSDGPATLQICLALNATSTQFQLTKVLCSHTASAVCQFIQESGTGI